MRKSIHRSEFEVLVGLLCEHREAAGATQAELSLALGSSQPVVSQVERGQRRLDVLELRDICQHLGVDFLKFVSELERRLRASSTRRPRR